MERSTDRLLTTHAGSLPRPPELTALLSQVAKGDIPAGSELEDLTEQAVASIIELQQQVGIDVGNDGEQGRESFFTYVQHRLSGFAPGDRTARRWTDMAAFPDFIELRRSEMSGKPMVSLNRPPQAMSEVVYGHTGAIDVEIERLRQGTVNGTFREVFMTAPSPGIVAAGMSNRFYSSTDEYLAAIGAALAVEYRRIVDAGFILQLDAPDLAMEAHGMFGDRPTSEFLGFVEQVIETINAAVAGLPADRIRLHVCWGNYSGPHIHDIPLAEILPLLYNANVGGLLISGGNPRHEHEYRQFGRHPLPDDWTLATGVIDTTTNYVEHPEVVADRLERVIQAVGDPTRVLACTDCGFDTAAGFGVVATDVVWAKLRALREGADLASERVF